MMVLGRWLFVRIGHWAGYDQLHTAPRYGKYINPPRNPIPLLTSRTLFSKEKPETDQCWLPLSPKKSLQRDHVLLLLLPPRIRRSG